MEISDREMLARRVYDELMTAVLRVLSRLDLTVTRDSDQRQVNVNIAKYQQVTQLSAQLKICIGNKQMRISI